MNNCYLLIAGILLHSLGQSADLSELIRGINIERELSDTLKEVCSDVSLNNEDFCTVVDSLFQCGANPNTLLNKEDPILLHFIKAGALDHADKINIFLSHPQIDVHKGDTNDYTPLMAATDYPKILRKIIRKYDKQKIDYFDRSFHLTALGFAVERKNIDSVRILLNAGASPIISYPGKKTALARAIEMQNIFYHNKEQRKEFILLCNIVSMLRGDYPTAENLGVFGKKLILANKQSRYETKFL